MQYVSNMSFQVSGFRHQWGVALMTPFLVPTLLRGNAQANRHSHAEHGNEPKPELKPLDTCICLPSMHGCMAYPAILPANDISHFTPRAFILDLVPYPGKQPLGHVEQNQ